MGRGPARSIRRRPHCRPHGRADRVTPDLDTTIDRSLAFYEAGTYDVQVDVITAETGETIVSLPFGVKSVGTEIEICD